MKRLLALLLALTMVLCLTACGGGSKEEPAEDAEPAADAEPAEGEAEEPAEEAEEPAEEAAAPAGDVSLTIFNTKSEIQTAMEAMAAEYSEATGVDVEIYYSNDTVAAHMATKYASNDPLPGRGL